MLKRNQLYAATLAALSYSDAKGIAEAVLIPAIHLYKNKWMFPYYTVRGES